MTKKDYEKFARVIEGMSIVGEPVIYSQQKDAYLAGAKQQAKFIAEELCSILLPTIPALTATGS
jgi:hypothetical protein